MDQNNKKSKNNHFMLRKIGLVLSVSALTVMSYLQLNQIKYDTKPEENTIKEFKYVSDVNSSRILYKKVVDDKSNKLLKETYYSYSDNGSKKDERTFDYQNQLSTIKKYEWGVIVKEELIDYKHNKKGIKLFDDKGNISEVQIDKGIDGTIDLIIDAKEFACIGGENNISGDVSGEITVPNYELTNKFANYNSYGGQS